MILEKSIWTIPPQSFDLIHSQLPCLIFQQQQQILLKQSDTLAHENNSTTAQPLPRLEEIDVYIQQHATQCYFLKDHQGQWVIAVQVPLTTPSPKGMNFFSLKSHFSGHENDQQLSRFAYTWQIIDWFNQHQFCGACGQPCVLDPQERAMVCHACQQTYFPRISPCVLVMVIKNDQILLARNAKFPKGRYSHVAGFMEPGETPEETAQREVLEEVGIRIKNIRYLKSQPWPFPRQLMLGFSAEYDSGELKPDGIEIVDAQWFDRQNFPPSVPSTNTLSGQLIEYYFQLTH